VIGTGTKTWLGVPTQSGIAPQARPCQSSRQLQKWWVKPADGGFQLINVIVQAPLVVGVNDSASVTQEAPDRHAPTVFKVVSKAPVVTRC
jgi:hypothetical protein